MTDSKFYYIEQIASLENLMLAWRKLDRAFSHGDVWFDELVIAEFRLKLVDNLQRISTSLLDGSYEMQKIQPIPFPKGGKDSQGKLKVRQSFFIDFRDQLVWVAVLNVIGRTFDIMMPAWSYGHRLYVSFWKDRKEDKLIWKVGNHRNTTRSLYRKWSQSWPMMRKRITASLKKMADPKKEFFDEDDLQVCEEENFLSANQSWLKLPYLQEGYFPKPENDKPWEKLYWAGLDLTQFYQKVKLDELRARMTVVLKKNSSYDQRFNVLLKKITDFKIDYSDYQYRGAVEDLKSMQLSKNGAFEGLPTGLIVAGFLANIFMLEIDNEVAARLKQERGVIHFRYVDDHVVIATSEEKLFDWIAWYQELLAKHGLMLNVEKITPAGLLDGLADPAKSHSGIERLKIKRHKEIFLKNILEYAGLDPRYPTPLMTMTLQKVSMLHDLNLNMLSAREFEMVFDELKSLLVTDFSEQEIKRSTRISFACSMLSRLMAIDNVDYEQLHDLRRQWMDRAAEIRQELTQKQTAGEQNQGDQVCQQLEDVEDFIFNDAKSIPDCELKEIVKKAGNTDENHCLENINLILKRGQDRISWREKQVFNMLMHALDQAPDKVRIWVRAFEYCVRHTPDQIESLYKKLRRYEDNTLHKLSVDYLTALLNTLCAEHIMQATARLMLEEYQMPSERGRDKEYLKNVRTITSGRPRHFFVRDSEFMLRKARAFFNLFADSLKLDAYEGAEPFLEQSVYHGRNLDSTFWLLWAADLLKYGRGRDRPVFTRLLENRLKATQTGSEYFKPFFVAYLREVAITEGTSMKLPAGFGRTAQRLGADLKYMVAHLPRINGLEQLQSCAGKDSDPASPDSKSVNLVQWIEEVNGLPRENPYFTMLHSELCASLIILSVVESIKSGSEGKEKLKLHPANFYLQRKELKQGWWGLIHLIDEQHVLQIQYRPDEKLKCVNYLYPQFLNSKLPLDTAIIYGLGLIFLHLLSKQVVRPWAFNSVQEGFEWQYVLHKLQGEGRISSYNYRILSACLSPRLRENILLSLLLQDEYVHEVYRDNPEIQDLEQLRTELKASVKQLRDNLVLVDTEKPRQLTVIDLE